MTGRSTRIAAISSALLDYDATGRPLPGIADPERREALAGQLVESARRTDYVRTVLTRDLSARRCDPSVASFDPVLAAVVKTRAEDYEEACWLVFLATHFGKTASGAWELCRAIYGRLGAGPIATWLATSVNVEELCTWIVARADEIRSGPPRRKFGNHRKFESLTGNVDRGTPATIRTYVDWIHTAGSHRLLLNAAVGSAEGDPYRAFDQLYHSMDVVSSFGRLAKFDYLSMLGKLELAPIKAGSTYLTTATGPLKGAALLFAPGDGPKPSPARMDDWLRELGEHLDLTMQDLEDAICNWQKSPDVFVPFRG